MLKKKEAVVVAESYHGKLNTNLKVVTDRSL